MDRMKGSCGAGLSHAHAGPLLDARKVGATCTRRARQEYIVDVVFATRGASERKA